MENVRGSCGFLNGIDVSAGLVHMGKGDFPNTNIRERLDKGVANSKRMEMFPSAMIQHFMHSFSDHCPLIICTEQEMNRLAGSIKSKRNGLKKKLTKKLEELAQEELDDENLAQIIDTKVQLNLEIDKDEMYWEQRARASWLKLGDKNTAFFLNYASCRDIVRINSIRSLKDEDGRVE
ncbi:uncharacterized protein [Gossypium hirsutum]|uniref:Reverse transcriptase n=1 Tax=Gossypium hirsutum TaxID=3635 RepID=A0A1U8NQB5_GOSHI|nr:uncharacterized protein LOC107949906 [Gossypium hirsutum]